MGWMLLCACAGLFRHPDAHRLSGGGVLVRRVVGGPAAGGNGPRPREFFLLGLLVGFIAMMVANILFLLPLVIAAIFSPA